MDLVMALYKSCCMWCKQFIIPGHEGWRYAEVLIPTQRAPM